MPKVVDPVRSARSMKAWLIYKDHLRRLDTLNVNMKLFDVNGRVGYYGKPRNGFPRHTPVGKPFWFTLASRMPDKYSDYYATIEEVEEAVASIIRVQPCFIHADPVNR